MTALASRALPKFESYAALEKAAVCGPRREAATDQFHGIDGLVIKETSQYIVATALMLKNAIDNASRPY